MPLKNVILHTISPLIKCEYMKKKKICGKKMLYEL